MKKYEIALTIAGSDSSGGAGIQADLKTFATLGCYGVSVITALTAQNTQGVQAILAVPPKFVRQQLDSCFSDIKIKAIQYILAGQVKHEGRQDLHKNLYLARIVSPEDVISMIKCCNGNCYGSFPHKDFKKLDVHVLKPKGRWDGYYIKFYFLEPDIMFISVHD